MTALHLRKGLLEHTEAWGKASSTSSWRGLHAMGLSVTPMVFTLSQSILAIYSMVPSVSGQLRLLWDIWDVLSREQ